MEYMVPVYVIFPQLLFIWQTENALQGILCEVTDPLSFTFRVASKYFTQIAAKAPKKRGAGSEVAQFAYLKLAAIQVQNHSAPIFDRRTGPKVA